MVKIKLLMYPVKLQ